MRKPCFNLIVDCPSRVPICTYPGFTQVRFDLDLNLIHPNSNQIPCTDSDDSLAHRNKKSGRFLDGSQLCRFSEFYGASIHDHVLGSRLYSSSNEQIPHNWRLFMSLGWLVRRVYAKKGCGHLLWKGNRGSRTILQVRKRSSPCSHTLLHAVTRILHHAPWEASIDGRIKADHLGVTRFFVRPCGLQFWRARSCIFGRHSRLPWQDALVWDLLPTPHMGSVATSRA